jgi:ribosome modulation factor
MIHTRTTIAGYDAAMEGHPRTDCPWSPTHPEGREWLLGWAAGANDAAMVTGDMARNTDEMRRQASADVIRHGWAQPDPTAILGDETPVSAPASGIVRVDVDWSRLDDAMAHTADVLRSWVDHVYRDAADAMTRYVAAVSDTLGHHVTVYRDAAPPAPADAGDLMDPYRSVIPVDAAPAAIHQTAVYRAGAS